MRVTDNLSEPAFKILIAVEQVLAEEESPQPLNKNRIIDGGRGAEPEKAGPHYSPLAQRLLERFGIAPHILKKTLDDLAKESLLLARSDFWGAYAGEGIPHDTLSLFGQGYLSWIANTPSQAN